MIAANGYEGVVARLQTIAVQHAHHQKGETGVHRVDADVFPSQIRPRRNFRPHEQLLVQAQVRHHEREQVRVLLLDVGHHVVGGSQRDVPLAVQQPSDLDGRARRLGVLHLQVLVLEEALALGRHQRRVAPEAMSLMVAAGVGRVLWYTNSPATTTMTAAAMAVAIDRPRLLMPHLPSEVGLTIRY